MALHAFHFLNIVLEIKHQSIHAFALRASGPSDKTFFNLSRHNQEDFFGQSSCYHTAIDRLSYPSIGIHDPNF